MGIRKRLGGEWKGTNRKMKWKGTLREFWIEKIGELEIGERKKTGEEEKREKKIIIKFLKPITSYSNKF